MRIKCLAQGNNILLPGLEPSTSVSKTDILANRPICSNAFFHFGWNFLDQNNFSYSNFPAFCFSFDVFLTATNCSHDDIPKLNKETCFPNMFKVGIANQCMMLLRKMTEFLCLPYCTMFQWGLKLWLWLSWLSLYLLVVFSGHITFDVQWKHQFLLWSKLLQEHFTPVNTGLLPNSGCQANTICLL